MKSWPLVFYLYLFLKQVKFLFFYVLICGPHLSVGTDRQKRRVGTACQCQWKAHLRASIDSPPQRKPSMGPPLSLLLLPLASRHSHGLFSASFLSQQEAWMQIAKQIQLIQKANSTNRLPRILIIFAGCARCGAMAVGLDSGDPSVSVPCRDSEHAK